MFKIKNTKVSKLKYTEPIEFFDKFANYKYNFIFNDKNKAIIGIFPYMIIKFENDILKLKYENDDIEIDDDFRKFLKKLINNFSDKFNTFPLSEIGLVGYLSYDLKDKLEKLDNKNNQNYSMPLFELVLYNTYYIFFKDKQILYKIDLFFEKQSKIIIKKSFQKGIHIKNFKTENSIEEYLQKVKKVKKYIFEGDIYEVNFTQQINADFKGNPYLIYKKLFKLNPAPFSSFLNFEKIIVSNSPELFLEVKNNMVRTKPIKGTINRGKTDEEDKRNRAYLNNSPKDRAELNMIIDLLRNDISRVCKYNTVKVFSKGHIEAFENVYHLVGDIRGELKGDLIDLIMATFPGGSITGCPKIRAMEIINEVEKYKRNIYTGSIIIMNNKRLISNIVIRTIVIGDNKLYFNAGGAITIDSDPNSEYREFKAKLSTIAKVLDYDGIL